MGPGRLGRYGGGSFCRNDQDVAAAAAGLQQRAIVVIAKFAAETIHVYLDEIREGIEGFVPDMFGDFRAADDTASIASEKFQESILLGGQGDGASAALGGLRGGIERQVSHHDLRGAEFRGPAQEGTKTGEQFAKFEGFGEVVVGAGIEAGDAVFDGIARGEHENRHALIQRTNGAADLKAIFPGNHHVENNEVIVVDFDLIQGVGAGGGHVDGVGLLLQTASDETHDAGIVFDEEQSHGSIIRQIESAEGGGDRGGTAGETAPCGNRLAMGQAATSPKWRAVFYNSSKSKYG